MPHDDANLGLLRQRQCEFCGASLAGKRRQARFCDARCRLGAWKRNREASSIRQAQEYEVEDVERQLSDGSDPIFIGGRPYAREEAWAAAAGLRATWAIRGALATAQTCQEHGQWWVLVQVPLGEFPG